MKRGGIFLCALLPAIAAAQNVRVRVAPLDGSEPCRADRALVVQLGSIAGIELTEKNSDFDAVLERDAANWKVSLRKTDGDIALRRSLSAAKECADVSFAAALVIERFVRALDLKVELPNLRSRADRAHEINAGAPRPDGGTVVRTDTGNLLPDPADLKDAGAPSARNAARPAVTSAAADAGSRTIERTAAAADAGSDVLDRAETRVDAGTASTDRPDGGSPSARGEDGPVTIDRTDVAVSATRPDAGPPDAVVSAIGRTREPPAPPNGPPAVRTPPIFTRVELAAGGGIWLNDLTLARPAFDASVGVFVWKRLRIAAQFALASTESVVIPGDGTTRRGDLTTQPFLAALDVGVCFFPNVFRVCGSAVGGTHFESATARGAFVFNDQTRWLARPTFGLDLQLAWLPVRALVLSLSGAALYTPGNTVWSVQGLEPEFGKSFPHFEGLLRVTVGFGADRG